MKATSLLLFALLCFHQLEAQTNTFNRVDTVDLLQNYYGTGPTAFSTGNFESEINVSGFPNDVISAGDQVRFIRLNIEHSSLDELEIWVECPNGSRAALINSFDGVNIEEIPGGYNGPEPGSGVFLGDPNLDGVIGNRGIGWEYSFSSYYNSFDEIETEKNNGNFVPAAQLGNNGNSMNPNSVYLPFESFDNFIGCPVDGTWKISIADYIDWENGTFFGWGFDIDGFLNTPTNSLIDAPLEIFPNPATSFIHVKGNIMNSTKYNVHNSIGSVVLSGEINPPNSNIDISALQSGVYFIQIDSATSRFVKE